MSDTDALKNNIDDEDFLLDQQRRLIRKQMRVARRCNISAQQSKKG